MNNRILRQLETIDWDFPEKKGGLSSSIHWYPGSFPAQLPATLIEALSEQGDLIFDPYGGVGTTSSEALRLGRKAWVVECNPIGVLTSYAMAGLILLKSYNANYEKFILAQIKQGFSVGSSVGELSLSIGSNISKNIDLCISNNMRPHPVQLIEQVLNNKPQWDLLSPWFEKRTLADIQKIYSRIMGAETGCFEKILSLTMLSHVMKASCSQTRSWGHLADNVRPKELTKKSLSAHCLRWVGSVEKKIFAMNVTPLSTSERSQIRCWISRYNWNDDEKIQYCPRISSGLLITSPPYANAIDYMKAQRLSLYLFGYDDNDIAILSGNEIGARKKRANAMSECNWADELEKALIKQLDLLGTEGVTALVLPHKDHGREVGCDRLRGRLEDSGWTRVFEGVRSILQIRARQSWTSIKRETIDIYEH